MLESLLPFETVEKRFRYCLLLGICYSIIALGISVIIFPKDPSLISLAIIILLLYPTVQKILLEHEKIEAKRYHEGFLSFFKEHRNVFIMYLLICMSIFGVFFTFSYLNPQSAGVLFEQQSAVVNPIGAASVSSATIVSYFMHNTNVLILIFIAAFILGEGGLLLLTWNASSWGVFFGVSFANIYSPEQALTALLIVLPHIMLEIGAYIIAAIGASILSKAFFSVHIPKVKRANVVNDTIKTFFLAIVTILLAALVESVAFLLIRVV